MLLTGCSAEKAEPLLLQATVVFPHDTIRFSLPVTTHRCSDDTALLFEATGPDGNGVLMRVRYRDSLVSGSYPTAMPDDTGKVPAAVIAVRYLVRETPRTFAFDSGTVEIRRHGQKVDAQVRGSGVESAIRTPSHLEYHDVQLRMDTVTCGYQP